VSERVADFAGKTVDKASELTDKVLSSAHAERRHFADYFGILFAANETFMTACDRVAAHHLEEAEIQTGMKKLQRFSFESNRKLLPFAEKYGGTEKYSDQPEELSDAVFEGERAAAFGLLRDLHRLFLLAQEVHVSLAIVMQAAKELRDEALVAVCIEADRQNKRQLAWLNTQIEHRASHTLVVPQ
jgi:ferredoxin-nitrate reductase